MPNKTTSVFMGSTEVPAERSAGEITAALVQAGARSITTEYNENGKVSAVKFVLLINGTQPVGYRLPARTQPVYMLLRGKQKKIVHTMKDEMLLRQRAERIGWRQLFRWVQAQIALIDIGMTTPQEVFMPYSVGNNGQTLFEWWAAEGHRMITGGTDTKQ